MPNIVFTKTFLFDLLGVPKDISKQVTEEIKVIQHNPQQGRIGKLKNTKQLDIFYRRIKHKYRLFYTGDRGIVKLLRLNLRSEKTYHPGEIKNIENDAQQDDGFQLGLEDLDISELFCDREDLDKQFIANSVSIFNRHILSNLSIPQLYWDKILTIHSEDDVFNLDLPEEYINILLDYLTTPHDLEYLENQTQYNADLEILSKLCEGEYRLDNFLAAFLQLDRKQEEYCTLGLNNKIDKCILIKGSAGTGKSLIAFHRVKKILAKNRHSKILFATYSKTLVDYTRRILSYILNEDPANLGVDIRTVDEIAIEYYTQKHDVPMLASESTQKELLKKATTNIINSQRLRINIREKLDKLGTNYLLDEFTKVIEAREINDFDTYKKITRIGQRFILGSRQRKAVWEIYNKWKQILQTAYGYQIQEWVNTKALTIVREDKIKIYDWVIVDEIQDLSPVALKILISIAKSSSGIYLTADTSQSLYQRFFSWNHLHKSVISNSIEKTLRNNYRNTAAIAKACIQILSSNDNDEAIDAKSLFIESHNIQGEKPTLILTDDASQVFRVIKKFFIDSEKKYRISRYEGAILSNDYQDNIETLVQGLNNNNLNSKLITQDNIDLERKVIKVLSIYAAKGLEFPFVCLVDFSENKLPLPKPYNASEIEQAEFINQQHRLLYVACSRATKSLLVIGSKSKPSPFISLLDKRYWNQLQDLDLWLKSI